MKIKILIIAVLGLFLTSCEDNITTQFSSDQAIREIRILNLQDNTSKLLSREVGSLNSIGFVDGSTIFFTTTYSYGKPSTGYNYADKIVGLDIDFSSKSTLFNSISYVNFLRSHNPAHILFESGGDIYKVTTDGSASFNLTNSTINETAGVLDEISNELYVGTKYLENNQLYILDLTTNRKNYLIENSLNHLYPLFLTQDKSRIIYYESNNVVSPNRGYLKILEINNLQNQKTLAEVSELSISDISKSNNDLVTFSSDGKIYLINISNDEKRVIAKGNSSNISSDGTNIIYSDGRNILRLYSVQDGNVRQLIYGESNYSYYPRFSPDGQTIVFIDSEFPLY
jgi:hypothetical protein